MLAQVLKLAFVVDKEIKVVHVLCLSYGVKLDLLPKLELQLGLRNGALELRDQLLIRERRVVMQRPVLSQFPHPQSPGVPPGTVLLYGRVDE